MAALGAEVVLVPSDHKRITEDLIREMIATARNLTSEPERYWTDQLNNRDGEAGTTHWAKRFGPKPEGTVFGSIVAPHSYLRASLLTRSSLHARYSAYVCAC